MTLDKLSHALEKWEEMVQQHEDSKKQSIEESITCDALIGLCSQTVCDYLKLNVNQLNHEDGQKIQECIDGYIQVEGPGLGSGPASMELDELQKPILALQKGKGGKGGGCKGYSPGPYGPYEGKTGKGKDGKQNTSFKGKGFAEY